MCRILGRMVAWRDVEQAAPAFAERVGALFEAHKHKTITTIGADIEEVVVTGLNAEATMLVIETWTPARGLRRIERA